MVYVKGLRITGTTGKDGVIKYKADNLKGEYYGYTSWFETQILFNKMVESGVDKEQLTELTTKIYQMTYDEAMEYKGV